jgi:hypothetical protein
VGVAHLSLNHPTPAQLVVAASARAHNAVAAHLNRPNRCLLLVATRPALAACLPCTTVAAS